jgi:tetratricopeptide (TPR) repeat protein/S1-C subfamily serine protease
MNKQLTIIPLCLIAIACTQSQPPPQPSVAASLYSKNLDLKNTTSPEKIARQITVRVLVGDRFSSGTIIAKRGNRYTILTNAHVTSKGSSYRITTPDGKTYPAKCAQPLKQGVCTADRRNDLALLEFTSSHTYTVPTWGDSRNLTPGETIYSAGFPFDRRDLQTNTGKVDIQTNKPLQGGYQIGFNLVTEPGMSGGSLLNAQGQLIGIIGFSSYPILNEGYQYQDGSQPAAGEIAQWRKSSFAIPLATVATIDRQYAALLPKAGGTTTIASNNYTGVVKKVDDIAQQITVRIEDKNGGNGSGVIVAREGDTYYVATAAHVIQEPRDDRQKIAIAVVTPTQERIVLSGGDINVVNKGLDIGVVKFKSKQNYQIATISKSEFNQRDWVFVSGFSGKDTSKQRQLSIGLIQHRAETAFSVKNQASLTSGYGLAYTNLSLPGMSGGAVLDRQGRLVGINTGAENEKIIPNGEYQEISFGLALGIPISTLLGVASGNAIPTARLQVTNAVVPKLSQSEDEEIYKIRSATLKPPNSNATANEWLDYGNLLWRIGKHRSAVTAFDRSIKLLERNPENSDRQDRLKLAYFGQGLAWWSNIEGSRSDNLQAAVVAFQQAVKIDPNFSLSWRSLGDSLHKLKRYEEAVVAYQKAIAKIVTTDPKMKKDFVLYVELGDIFKGMKRDREAIDSYTQAIGIKPTHPWAYINRGSSYQRQGKLTLAIADYTQAIKIDSQDPFSYNNRGTIYINLKQFTKAIADINEAIRLDPQFAGAYSNRGNAYNGMNQYSQALADYNRSIELDPQSAMAHYNRGLFYQERKEYTRSLANYDLAIKLDPQLAQAYNNRGNIYKKQKKYDRALADYNRTIKLDPQLVQAYSNRGLIYQEQKQYSQALADFSRAIEIDPKLATAYSDRGAIYQEQKQYDRALADFNRAIELNSNLAMAYCNRGAIYSLNQAYSQAITDFSRAIKLDPQLAIAYYNRGLAYTAQERYPQAIADYAEAIKINPQDEKSYNNRGLAYLLKEEYPQSISDFSSAIKIDPQHASAYHNRGIVYAMLQQYPQAKTDLRAAVKLFRAQNDAAGYEKAMGLLQKLGN